MSSRRVAALGGLVVASFVVTTAVGPLGGGTASAALPDAPVPQIAARPAASATKTTSLVRTTEVIAHRGDVSAATENTPAAIRAAFRNGADAVEFDVVWSKDDQLIVLHDTDLGKNTTNCTGRTFHKTYAQLRKCRTLDGNPIPNPYETLAVVRDSGKKVYVHVKTPAGHGLGTKFMRAVNRYGLNSNGRAVFFNDKRPMLDELKRAGAANLGLIFFDKAAKSAWASNYPILIPFQTKVTPELVRAAQRRGQKVIPVESRPVTQQEALGMGVDSMIVNNLADALETFR